MAKVKKFFDHGNMIEWLENEYILGVIHKTYDDQKGFCLDCNKKVDRDEATASQRLTVNRGGSRTYDNICMLCQDCYISRHAIRGQHLHCSAYYLTKKLDRAGRFPCYVIRSDALQGERFEQAAIYGTTRPNRAWSSFLVASTANVDSNGLNRLRYLNATKPIKSAYGKQN